MVKSGSHIELTQEYEKYLKFLSDKGTRTESDITVMLWLAKFIKDLRGAEMKTKNIGAKSVKLNTLLACPFCGEQPHIHKRKNGLWEVRCINENCGVIAMTDEKISKKLAIETWNIRVS